MAPDYPPRFLAGVLFFNEGDYFEAHEVWEDQWHETHGPDRRFLQGMIQVAVGLLHFANGNVRGALRLYASSRDYLQPFRPGHLGLDLEKLFAEQEACYAELLAAPEPKPRLEPEDALLPHLELTPPPSRWPNPRELLPPEDEKER